MQPLTGTDLLISQMAAILTALGVVVAAVGTLVNIWLSNRNHGLINSMNTANLQAREDLGQSKGQLTGRAEGRKEAYERDDSQAAAAVATISKAAGTAGDIVQAGAAASHEADIARAALVAADIVEKAAKAATEILAKAKAEAEDRNGLR